MLIFIFQKRFLRRQQISRADTEAIQMIPRPEHQHQFQLPRTPTVVLSNVYIFGAAVGTSAVEEIGMEAMTGIVEEC